MSSEPIICLLVLVSAGGWMRTAEIPCVLPAGVLGVPSEAGPWMILLLQSFSCDGDGEAARRLRWCCRFFPLPRS
uniref:Uncharacterized protein n=1 Tax=Setaria italica TaxID=4555 RepID=K3Y463_SETIT